MNQRTHQNKGLWKKAREGVAVLLLLAMLISLAPTALAANMISDEMLQQTYGFAYAGTSPGIIAPSTPKVYVRLAVQMNIFKSDTTSVGVSAPAGTVVQLLAKTYYTAGDGRNYIRLYYDNELYNVLADDIAGSGIMTTAQLTSYITDTVWRETLSTFSVMKSELKQVGNVRVHALQYALQLMGFYSGVMDGQFGSGTQSAVKAFQRANSLEADGSAGPDTLTSLYAMALARYSSGTTGDVVNGSSGSPGSSTTTGSTGTTSATGTLTTTANVNLRKSASASAARLAVVPKGISLTYTGTTSAGGVVWYNVVFGGNSGWLMGSFVSAGGSSGGSTNTSNAIGTITIIKTGTRVRKTPNGVKTGIALSIGSTASYYSTSTVAGYTWYYISTNGIYGYVRSDCASASASASGGTIPSTEKIYAQLAINVDVFTAKAKPATGFITIPAGTVIQMVSSATYMEGNQEYCSVYYNNTAYNALYSDVKPYIMPAAALTTYITDVVWKSNYPSYPLKEEMKLVGDVKVHAAQMALSVLGYYSGGLDGKFGSGTASAVRNFQRQNSLEVDGSVGPLTWVKLFPMALTKYTSGTWTPDDGTGTPDTAGTVVGDFGTVKSVEMAKWSVVNNNAVSLFPKSSTATVLDVETGKVFTIYRWSGGSHADCVPLTSADTKVMCDIAGFPYNSSHPSTSQFNTIVSDSSKSSNANYAWPDFPNGFSSNGGARVGGAWDRRPALLNVDGRVFAVSIYGWPHGISDSSFQKATRNGTLLYKQNNYYGMMCVHFVESTTHSSTASDPQHQAAIQTAYNYAKSRWPSLCK